MTTITPGPLLGAPKLQLFTNEGAPAAGYKLATFIAGTSTPLDTYSDSLLTTPNANPIELDAFGRATVYMQPGQGYKFTFADQDDAPVWTADNVVDLGSLLFGLLISTDGSKGVADGYVLTNDDIFITVDTTAGVAAVFLQAAAERFRTLWIKNVGTHVLTVTPAGADKIDGVAAGYAVPAGATPLFPTIELQSNGSNAYWIRSSHGIG